MRVIPVGADGIVGVGQRDVVKAVPLEQDRPFSMSISWNIASWIVPVRQPPTARRSRSVMT